MSDPHRQLSVHSLDPAALGTGDDPLDLDAAAPPGTYALVFAVPETTIEVGALGACQFPAGGYVYVGSAFGSGGLRRVLRHRRVARGEHDARHWHVDYLGGHPDVELVEVICVTDRDAECAVASELGPPAIGGFGSSDCSCKAHLTRHRDAETAASTAVSAFRGEN
ncbi:GIY-YIG nuclease family protein [Haloferax mediterranei ATCC 33500]|uniref:Endonuclease associated protein n=1 Tax=Haloferax mediterranei (strain ATCC 33500 / DSM 1411 / JCM 8866 / NBRC 14739 / NCIMB 2177 / R-4) TaxID=523841 RepID=I3R5I5_HALMT|nr:GIY-YIG nuclease family protein [Haloferax mediterranei]AFK19495.1 endonuclease associated protein [Haloferax mediterranei ATCC 33500]AHZ21163.1 hypothetical protein BM92_00145 [Haloferax mediterranei ATCC 33500]EMA04317.1 endonuclease associated protein [Haloferax mediterranei ATCC 33500]MDX5989598.1 GIY-YIG nuclease family protein [Haloferax mediterranei ATCC 33500]QCQ75954.1 GIY-YIG nuclease family protein [Haloferax mediterranei ATCC 33500]